MYVRLLNNQVVRILILCSFPLLNKSKPYCSSSPCFSGIIEPCLGGSGKLKSYYILSIYSKYIFKVLACKTIILHLPQILMIGQLTKLSKIIYSQVLPTKGWELLAPLTYSRSNGHKYMHFVW